MNAIIEDAITMTFEKQSCNQDKSFCSKASQTECRNLFKCGEIFISANDELLLNCSFCEKSSKILDSFWDHLLGEHSSTTNKIKLEIQSKTTNEISHKYPNTYEKSKPDGEVYTNNEDHDIKYNRFNDFKLPNIIKESTNCESQLNKTEDLNVEKGYWQCNVCQIILKKGNDRKLHEKTHKGLKKLICETCGKAYTTRRRLLDHMRSHTGERPFKCRFCPKTFCSNSGLKSHDKTHFGVKPFQCEYCEHRFRTKFNKQVHEQKHHKDKLINIETEIDSNIACKLCNKTFKCTEYLLRHLKRHEENLNKSSLKPFECNFCPSTFFSKFSRNAHERLNHKGEYNYKCEFCGKAFLKLSRKRQHEETHTRIENPYKCDLCERAYARSITLKKHKLAKHAKDSPYYCKVCQTRFESIILFKEHCKQHYIEEKLHGCKYCEARFDTQIILDRHISKMHKNIGKQVDDN
ncbi:zinc finger protein 791-like [Condylostylus longicornis]|uniref:zinc finger protein 791-like n=1 Tax=Condylostylus longicornis TaxID=2530218 RepID=UPI00244E1E86|nr:zinc finger protein 791-like [Condylostylus longicornis]